MRATSPHPTATAPSGPNPTLAEGAIAPARKRPLFLLSVLAWLGCGASDQKQQPAGSIAAQLLLLDAALSPRAPAWRIWMRVLRVHQWSKNLLLLVPVLTAHAWHNSQVVLAAALGVCAFHLLASSAYVINDLVDLDADRSHPSKRLRPFASGALSPLVGLWLAPLLMAGGLGLAAAVSWKFLQAALVYLAATLAYSLWLKREALLDVMVLAGLYTWRVLAGAVAAGVILSPWLLGFSIFIFLSLALVKRCTELRRAGGGRGYTVRDYEQLARLGTASSYVAVLIMALYISSAEIVRLYPQPVYLWGICPVLIYWLSRIWLLADRGTMNDDPVLFAIGDRASYISAAIILAFLAVAMRTP